MNMSDYHMTPLPETSSEANPVVIAIAAFFVVGLIFALFYLWLSD